MSSRLAAIAFAILALAGAAHARTSDSPVPRLGPMTAEARQVHPTAQGIVRQVIASGTTKPVGSALDARLGTNTILDRRSRALDRQIRTAICTGC